MSVTGSCGNMAWLCEGVVPDVAMPRPANCSMTMELKNLQVEENFLRLDDGGEVARLDPTQRGLCGLDVTRKRFLLKKTHTLVISRTVVQISEGMEGVGLLGWSDSISRFKGALRICTALCARCGVRE